MDLSISFQPSVEELKKVTRKLSKIEAQLLTVIERLEMLQQTQDEQGEQMSLDISRVESEVSENTDAVESASILLDTLADELRAAAGNQAAVNALADTLSNNSDRLAAAVVRNTPASPEPTPTPAPTPAEPTEPGA